MSLFQRCLEHRYSRGGVGPGHERAVGCSLIWGVWIGKQFLANHLRHNSSLWMELGLWIWEWFSHLQLFCLPCRYAWFLHWCVNMKWLECRDRASVKNLTSDASLNVISQRVPKPWASLVACSVDEKTLNPRVEGWQRWRSGMGAGWWWWMSKDIMKHILIM